MAKDTGAGLVMIFPACAVKLQLFAEGSHFFRLSLAMFAIATDTNQTVGDIAGRLNFHVTIARVRAVRHSIFTPYQIFSAFTATGTDGAAFAVIGIDIDTTCTRIPAFAGCPVFEGAVLGTPPDQIGAIFVFVFVLIARGTRLPDALIGKTNDAVVFFPADIRIATEFTALTTAKVLRFNPFGADEVLDPAHILTT